MAFGNLRLLLSPAFVIPWYALGLVGAAWTRYDSLKVNRHVQAPLKAAWPIIIIVFSVVSEVFYVITCRPPHLATKASAAGKPAHHAFVAAQWKNVVGSTIHCVGGDGLGIMTAMVIVRLIGVGFWTEFGLEYAVGFAFGWRIFQTWSMREQGNSWPQALWMGGRAEFFSRITLMLGMGLVMRFVTPAVVGERPLPTTADFWGFGALGLLVGGICTYPMNWWRVSIGWKHGMN